MIDEQSPSNLAVAPPLLARHSAHLAAADTDMAYLIARLGLPSFPSREEGFLTLLTLILEQQVSTAAASAVRDRLLSRQPLLTPRTFLALDGCDLRACGFSRQKAAYGRALAEAMAGGAFRPEDLRALSDEAAVESLTRLRGIGRWTAEVYLLFALGRPDVWPAGDLALRVAAGRLKGLARRPDEVEARALSKLWSPWRSTAALLLWHFYRTDRLAKWGSPSTGAGPGLAPGGT